MEILLRIAETKGLPDCCENVSYRSQMSETKFSPKLRILLVGVALSSIGNGLVLPYLFIYLHSVRHLPSAVAGGVVGYGAVIGLISVPIVGNLIDHWGPKPVLTGALIVCSVGYYQMSGIHSIWQAFAYTTICSFGQAGLWPAQAALASELTAEDQRPRYFGAQFALLNLGLGIGGLVSSLVVVIGDTRTFENLFKGDGLSYLIYVVVLLFVRGVGHRSSTERTANSAREGGWREVLADKAFVQFWLVAIGAIFFSYAQLEVGFASFAFLVANVQPSNIARAFGANMLLIAVFQLWMVAKVAKHDRGKLIATASLLWIFAWIALAFSGILPSHAVIFLILCQSIFAIGEMVWSPVLPSVINQMAPDHLRGRYNSAGAGAWTIASIAGPIVAGTLLGAQLQWMWISILIIGLVLVCFAALRLKLPRPVVSES